jgi:predicted nuclease of predicted toxin-antitoxin system
LKFLVDRCAGHILAIWLRNAGHDVVEVRELGEDPGDRELLRLSAAGGRVLITLDKDFGRLVYAERGRHAGLLRLPDVPAADRVALVTRVLEVHRDDLEKGAVITVRGNRIRVSRPS